MASIIKVLKVLAYLIGGLFRGNEIIMSWERDIKSLERDNYVVGTISYVVGTRSYVVGTIQDTRNFI